APKLEMRSETMRCLRRQPGVRPRVRKSEKVSAREKERSRVSSRRYRRPRLQSYVVSTVHLVTAQSRSKGYREFQWRSEQILQFLVSPLPGCRLSAQFQREPNRRATDFMAL